MMALGSTFERREKLRLNGTTAGLMLDSAGAGRNDRNIVSSLPNGSDPHFPSAAKINRADENLALAED